MGVRLRLDLGMKKPIWFVNKINQMTQTTRTQTTRTIGGVAYTFTYNYENHLTGVSGGSISASFVYDADGNRVQGTVNGTTTVYIAGLYEYQGGATTLYYEGNSMRRAGYVTDNGVFYLLQDQLKSSSVFANRSAELTSKPERDSE